MSHHGRCFVTVMTGVEAILPKILSFQSRCFRDLELLCCWLKHTKMLGFCNFVAFLSCLIISHIFILWVLHSLAVFGCLIHEICGLKAWIAVADVVLWATAQHASDQGRPLCPTMIHQKEKGSMNWKEDQQCTNHIIISKNDQSGMEWYRMHWREWMRQFR